MIEATERQQREIKEILAETSIWFPLYANNGVHIDDFISYDDMARVVDYLRGDVQAMRNKAKRAVVACGIDKVWLAYDTVYLQGADREKAEAFLVSLGEFGYDTEDLLLQYRSYGRVSL